MPAKARKSLAQVKSVSFEVRYPLALATLELLVQDGPSQTPRDEVLVLTLQPESARALSRKFAELADEYEKFGGAKQ